MSQVIVERVHWIRLLHPNGMMTTSTYVTEEKIDAKNIDHTQDSVKISPEKIFSRAKELQKTIATAGVQKEDLH